MSGECDECGNHTLECTCMRKDCFPIKNEKINFIFEQIKLISMIECLLEQLLKTTYEEYSLRCGTPASYFPEKALSLMDTMKHIGELDIKYEKKKTNKN